MIVMMGLLKCEKGFGASEMLHALRKVTTKPNSSDSPRRHTQNIVTDRSQKGIDYARASLEIDAFSQLLFSDISSARNAIVTGGSLIASGLQGLKLESRTVLTTIRNTVVPPPITTPALKRMSLLRRKSNISAEEFQEQWFTIHSTLVRRLPGLLGYRQNLVIDQDSKDPALSFDGVVELWFEDGAAIERAFRSDRGNTTMMHAREFIGEISTYLVEPVELDGVP